MSYQQKPLTKPLRESFCTVLRVEGVGIPGFVVERCESDPTYIIKEVKVNLFILKSFVG